MSDQTHVIVGASLAGASAAAALRKQGFEGRVVLIGDEHDQPYERPELSKKYLGGELDEPPFVQPATFYDDANVELKLDTSVTGIDVARNEVATTDGVVAYDRLLLATGAEPRRLKVPGADLDGVLTLRTRADADELRARALEAESIVVIGGGWIGSEVAASLRQLSRTVTLVFPTKSPLEGVLGADVGAIYGSLHAEHGVRLVGGTTAVALAGRDKVERVTLADGSDLAADLVVVGIGAAPRTNLATAAGLDVDDGVLVNERLEASEPGIYAAGDVANAWSPRYGRRLRVEHWDNAKRQGRTAAANMLGQAKPYDRIPYFYSDQYDVGMEYTGFAPDWDDVVIRGDRDGRSFVAFWLKNDAVVAGMNVNVWDVRPAIERLVSSGAVVDRRALADVGRPLDDVVAEAEAVATDPERTMLEGSLAR
jgi:3-phenylpropionate/trans-cinnamate dioxygenase ferredoxin reductase component